MSIHVVSEKQFSELKGYAALRPWVVTLVAALFFMYQFAQVNMFNALGPAMLNSFHIDALQLGNLSAMSIYANVLLLPVAGLILDRFSARRIILLGMFVSVVFTGVFSYAETYWLAAASRFIAGTAGAFCFLGCIVMASRWFPASKMAIASGLIVTMGMLGGALAQEPMALMIDQYGWHIAVRSYAILGFVFWIVMFIILADSPEKRVDHPAGKSTLAGLKESACVAVKNTQNWFCGGYTSAMNLIILVIGAIWGAGYLESVHGIDHLHATRITSFIFFGSMIGSPLVGAFSDSIKKRRMPMLLGAWASLLLIMIVILSHSLSLMVLSGLFFLLGFTTSTQVLTYPVIAESNAPEHTGVCEALASFMIMGSGAICQDIFGMLMNYHAVGKLHASELIHYNASDYQYAFWLLPIGFLLSLIFGYFAKETNAKSIVS